MIIEQHYDDEVLIGLLDEAEEDTHVPVCDTCTGTLESYRDLSAALHDDSVWDERELPESASPQTTNFLRTFAERTRAEDIAAGPIVAKLVTDPTSLEQHPEWRTAGVVRGILTHLMNTTFSDPQSALALSKVAVAISNSLESTSTTTTRLRASAWHEFGYSLYSADQYLESLGAYEKAEELYRESGVFEFDAADVALHRAQVYGDLERIDEALAIVRRVREVYRRYGSLKREAAADATEATLLFRVRRFSEALPVFQRIAADTRADETSRALAYHNAADCLGQLCRFDDAKKACVRAIAEFERLRLASMRTRSRWVLGRILLAEKSYESALATFKVAQDDFADLHLHHEVALISVDTAEALWMLGRSDELAQHCQAAMNYFAEAGLAYTRGALTALAYLKEAAETHTLSKTSVGQVRNFFEVLPKQPHLLFAFPL